jgi:hypothetical protein
MSARIALVTAGRDNAQDFEGDCMKTAFSCSRPGRARLRA